MPENNLTMKYFFEEYHRFRQEMCSRKPTIDQKLNMFMGLVYVYLNVRTQNQEEEERLQTSMTALKEEFDMRLGYQASMEIESMMSGKRGVAIGV